MIEDRDLQSLVEFAGTRPVLSVYLDTDLADKSKAAVKLMLRNRIGDLKHQGAQEVRAVQKYLDFEFDWQSRGLAIFASGDDLWMALPLPVPVGVQATVADRPYVRPLTDVLDRFGKYGVAVVDRESVRLFSVAWGRILPETEAFGEELKHHRQGGWAAARYQRHEDNLALHNLKQAVEVIQAFCTSSECQNLVLAGSSEALSQIRGLMPNQMRRQIMGEFIVEMTASPDEILSRSLDVAVQMDLAAEKQMVSEAVTAAAKGGAGVTGLSDTLHLLHQGRVRMLLVDASFAVPGQVCAQCGYAVAELADDESGAKCPFCGQEAMKEAADVVNQAIYKAVETGAGVNIVRNSAELATAGGIAALLRY